MDHKRGNIFNKASMPADGAELSEMLLDTDCFKIERILSDGQITPDGFWYDQPGDEWVILLQGEAVVEFEEIGKTTLAKGDYLWIQAHARHRVTYTSNAPQCIWLAVHSNR
jgi:cupin 2 domain-containing protein